MQSSKAALAGAPLTAASPRLPARPCRLPAVICGAAGGRRRGKPGSKPAAAPAPAAAAAASSTPEAPPAALSSMATAAESEAKAAVLQPMVVMPEDFQAPAGQVNGCGTGGMPARCSCRQPPGRPPETALPAWRSERLQPCAFPARSCCQSTSSRHPRRLMSTAAPAAQSPSARWVVPWDTCITWAAGAKRSLRCCGATPSYLLPGSSVHLAKVPARQLAAAWSAAGTPSPPSHPRARAAGPLRLRRPRADVAAEARRLP